MASLKAVSAVEKSSVDGAVVFVWSNLLEEALKQDNTRRVDARRVDARRVDAIRAVAERRQAQLA